jgi:hypothetical protein
MAKKKENYFMVRTYSSGVFAGEIVSKKPNGPGHFQVVLKNARRIYQWTGAASLSQLATDGTSNPSGCKFPCEVSSVELAGAIEIIPITAKAKASIASVPVWKA